METIHYHRGLRCHLFHVSLHVAASDPIVLVLAISISVLLQMYRWCGAIALLRMDDTGEVRTPVIMTGLLMQTVLHLPEIVFYLPEIVFYL